jgi:hypothetical protein
MDGRPSDIEIMNAGMDAGSEGLSIVWEDYVEDSGDEMERVVRTISEC